MTSGEDNTLDIDITPEQYNKWEGGMHIQDAAPNLSADHREFIMTGITPDEWNNIFQWEPLDKLAAFWSVWCEEEGLECMSADEMPHYPDITREQDIVIANFRQLWDSINE